MWEEMWENGSENPLFIYKIQYLMRWFGTSPATTRLPPLHLRVEASFAGGHDPAGSGVIRQNRAMVLV